MEKNLLDLDWEKFEKTGNVIDYLKYKSREKMVNRFKMNATDMEVGIIEGVNDVENIQGKGDSN